MKRRLAIMAAIASVVLAMCVAWVPAIALASTDMVPQEMAAQSTQVELYRVQVTGGIGGTIGVGDTLTAVPSKIKTAQGSTSTYEAELDEGDEVAFKWQYANTKTTNSSSFTDIEGATSATYTIPPSMEGKYLRVQAISQNTVVSTSRPYYGTTQSVDPVGPVQATAGAVELSSVALVSTLSNSMWVGAVVTPTAKYLPQGQYLEQPVPQDAQVTYTWEVADSASGPFAAFDAATYPQSSVSASGELSIGADLTGKFVRLKANALVNTVSSLVWPVLPQGVYDLMRITFGYDTLYTGSTITTQLQAKTLEYENEASFGTTVPIDDPNSSYQWYATIDEPVTTAGEQDFSACTWEPIEGATSADLVIPESAAGCYVKVVATSSKNGVGTSVERASTTRVQAGGTLQQALEKLQFFHPKPVWGTATNMNDVVSAKLATLGYSDVTVKTKSFARSVESDAAHLGVSVANDATNGDVTFFTYDNAASVSSHNFSIYHQVTVTFELSREGETPVEFTATTNIPWDLDAAQAIVDTQVSGLAVGYVDGDNASSVTQNLTLPCKAGILWVTWASDVEESLSIYRDESSPTSFWDPYTGIVSRGANDVAVALTANVEALLIDSSDDTLEALDRAIEFPVTVKGDSALIGNMNAALAQAIDSTFVYAAVTDFATSAAIDPTGVTGDLSLPTTRVLFKDSGLDSGDYKVSYSSNNETAMRVNGYRTYTLQPLPGSGNATANISVTVTHKKMPEVTYTKALAFTVPALNEADIDADIACMEQVRNSIFEGYSEGLQEQNAVVSDLHAFQRAYFTADGKLHWKYSYSDKSDAACSVGFSPQTVADNPSGDASYSNFVSSHPVIVKDSSLQVTRATRDIGVTITCCLTSDRFGAYYERYASDPACSDELKEKFRKLYRQKIPCQITVKGTQVSTAVREELVQAADEAEALLSGIETSADGADVAEDATWVPEATMKSLKDAIVAARAVAARDTATEADIQAAQDVLQQARTAFESARKPGTCAYATATQKKALAAAADDAEAQLANVYSSTDGKDVDPARSWAPYAVIDALYDAIDKARDVAAGKNVTEAAVNEARADLATARLNFEHAVKKGLKSSSADAVAVGKRYTAGSGASKATYLVKTLPKGSKAGTVWYVSSLLSKKTATSAVVPATVKIKGVTYRVVRVSSGAFADMGKLSKVTLGANVAKVASGAFNTTPKLKSIVVKGMSLSKASCVKGALSKSEAGKITVKVTKAFKKKAKKVFTQKNLSAPKAVTVK